MNTTQKYTRCICEEQKAVLWYYGKRKISFMAIEKEISKKEKIQLMFCISFIQLLVYK